MHRERISDEIYVFTSSRYAQVTAGAILTKEGVILIDTLFFPDETKAIRDFLELRLGQQVRYVINTHYHSDHTMGNCVFPKANIVSHKLCRDYLIEMGDEGLNERKQQNSEFANASIVLPNIVLTDGTMDITLGGKTVRLMHMPGHSLDLINAHVIDQDIMFASDNMMPVPTMFDGGYDELVGSLTKLRDLSPDMVVRGHGEVMLRGEVVLAVEDDLKYLEAIHEKVSAVVKAGKPESALAEIDIESCGKSRIPLNGDVTVLHNANLETLYEDLMKK